MALSTKEISDPSFWRAVLAEFMATAIFVMNVTMVVTLSAGFGGEKIIVISLAIGMSVSVLAQTFGPVCGAHLNPAVTVGLLVQGSVSIVRACLYVTVQLVGGIVGSGITYALIPKARHGSLGAIQPASDMEPVQAFFVELILTMILLFTVFSSTSTDHGRKDFGFANALAIGLAVTVAHLVGIPLTGSGINPARALGPSVVTSNFHSTHWLYWIGPLVGGVCAGLIYRFFLSIESSSKDDDNKVHGKDAVGMKSVSAA